MDTSARRPALRLNECPPRASNLPEYLRRVKYVLHYILCDLKIKPGIDNGESLQACVWIASED